MTTYRDLWRSTAHAAAARGMLAMMQRTRGAVLLANLGLDQGEIARRCGVSQAAVSHWTTGRAVPRDDRKVMLRDAYGIPIVAWYETPTVATQPRAA